MTPRLLTSGPSSCPAVGEAVIRLSDRQHGIVDAPLNVGECGPRELRCTWADGSTSIELRAAVVRLSTAPAAPQGREAPGRRGCAGPEPRSTA